MSITWVCPQGLKQLEPSTLHTGSSNSILQQVTPNEILILDNGHGCLCVSHLGKIIWGDGAIIEGSSCQWYVTYVIEGNWGKIYCALQKKDN